MAWNFSSLNPFYAIITLQILLPGNFIYGLKLKYDIMEVALSYLEMFLLLVDLAKLLAYSPTLFDKDFSTAVPPKTASWGLTLDLILYCTSAYVFGILTHNIKYWVIFFLTYSFFLDYSSLWNFYISNIFLCSLLDSTWYLKL